MILRQPAANAQPAGDVMLDVPLTALAAAACLLQVQDPPVRVLVATGEVRAGLPVAAPHPDPGPYLRVLTRGYAARLLRLYQLEQRFVRPDRAPQPGTLVITGTEGGFARWGLHLDSPQPELAYVDLHRRSRPSGRFAAIDQIFPHELLHVIVRDLAGEAPDSPSTQVHAIGVKTDRVTALNEGFAEHGQIMAIDDPDALPETAALRHDAAMREMAFGQFDAYRRAMSARLAIAPKARMTFPFWFSGAEQVLRYHAVKDHLFALEPDVPGRLYSASNAFPAYLLENTLPGRSGAAAKPLPRLIASEGAVAAFFHRVVTDEALGASYRDETFYRMFGVEKGGVDPLDNIYLKLFAAIRKGKYDVTAVMAAYRELFPDERPAFDAVVARTFFTASTVPPPELWVLNGDARVGTSVFDQFRGLPRSPSFDLNAASRADLVAVAGIDLALADRIIAAAPFAEVADLRRVDSMPALVVDRLLSMRQAMLAPESSGVSAEGRLTFRGILMPYAWRALAVWLLCAAIGAVLHREVRRLSWKRAVLNGLAAAAVTLLAGWIIGSSTPLPAAAATLALFGLPAAAIRLVRTRSGREALMVAAAWLVATVPALVALTPM